jgi:hypothetical protein
VEERFSGAASGVNNAIARTAALLAVAVLGAVMLAAFTSNLRDILLSSQLTSQQQIQILTQYDKLGGIVIPDGFDESARMIAQTAISKSFIMSFRWAMGVCMVLALLGSAISFLTIHRGNWPKREEIKCEYCVKHRGMPL